MNPPPAPPEEGSPNSQFPSWEGLGVGSGHSSAQGTTAVTDAVGWLSPVPLRALNRAASRAFILTGAKNVAGTERAATILNRPAGPVTRRLSNGRGLANCERPATRNEAGIPGLVSVEPAAIKGIDAAAESPDTGFESFRGWPHLSFTTFHVATTSTAGATMMA